MDASKMNSGLLLKGILLGLVGMIFIFSPEATIKLISLYLGLTMVAVSLGGFWFGYKARSEGMSGVIGFVGPTVLLISGLVLIFFPNFSITLFAISIGLWIIIDGSVQIRISRALERSGFRAGPWLMIMGIISIVVGILILANPKEFLEAMTIVFGLVMLFTAGMLIYVAFPRN